MRRKFSDNICTQNSCSLRVFTVSIGLGKDEISFHCNVQRPYVCMFATTFYVTLR